MTKIGCYYSLFAAVLLAGNSVVWAEEEGTDLGGGVVTRTDVKYFADLTLDIRDMQDIIANEAGSDAALAIYVNGKNSVPKSGTLFKLSELSSRLASDGVSKASPQYLFHLYGMAERDDSRLSENLSYADNYVRSAILEGNKEAATAALVLNVWMYATHLLFQGMDTCQKLMEADNEDQFTLGTAGFDEFIALWIGTGSNPGSENGDSLYAIAEEAYDLFGGVLDESETNTKLKSLYQEGSSQLSIPGVCTKQHPESPRIIWSIATQMISQMMVPLIRQLIVAVIERDVEKTKVYAKAVVPQTAQCRPSVYGRLKNFLLAETPLFDKANVILRDLQDIYSCFGLTCDDIGDVVDTRDVNVPICVAANPRAPLAAYNPSTDVHSVSRVDDDFRFISGANREMIFCYLLIWFYPPSHISMPLYLLCDFKIATIDLDILQLRILTSLGSFHYAKLWYLYGRNSPVERKNEYDPFSYYSVADLALSSSRRVADPWFSEFVKYHDNNNYADKIIRDTLNGAGKWDSSKTVAQRSAVITETSSFMVLYLHLIAQINDAVNICKGMDSGGTYNLTQPWDEVAALLIGSLEGTQEGGSSDAEDGQLLWSLGSRRAFQFQSLGRDGHANINSRMGDLLYAGKGEIDATECTTLEKTATQLKLASMVPILQTVLRYAIQNEELTTPSESVYVALGETFALAIIPIMELIDPSSSAILQENMIFQDGIPPVRDGAQAVADAIGNFAVSAGLRCSVLGYTPQASPCRLHGGSAAPPSLRPMVLLTALSSVVLSLFFIW